jgi:hypothetical protein
MTVNDTEKAEKKARKVTRFSAPVNEDELEFIQAIDRFKRQHGRPFPSWSEVLTILKSLGYSKAR